MPFENTRAKALAAVSEAEADCKRLEAELSSTRTKHKLIVAGDQVVDKVTGIPVVKENTEFLRKHTDAQVADSQADIDELEADLATARTKLRWAQRALNAVDNVNETMADIADATADALDDAAAGSMPDAPRRPKA